MKKGTAIAIVLACIPLVGCVGGDDSIFARMGAGGAGGGAAAGSSSGGGAAAGGGASGGQVAATGGAISAGSGATEVIPDCKVLPGESWAKCRRPIGGDAAGLVTPAPVVPAIPTEMGVQDPLPGVFGNVPGVQEVHWMASPNHCRDLFKKLKREGYNFTGYRHFPARMPGDRQQGQCKIFGPDAVDDRFIDKRYDKDN